MAFPHLDLYFSHAMLTHMIFDLYFYSLVCNICMTNCEEPKKSLKVTYMNFNLCQIYMVFINKIWQGGMMI